MSNLGYLIRILTTNCDSSRRIFAKTTVFQTQLAGWPYARKHNGHAERVNHRTPGPSNLRSRQRNSIRSTVSITGFVQFQGSRHRPSTESCRVASIRGQPAPASSWVWLWWLSSLWREGFLLAQRPTLARSSGRQVTRGYSCERLSTSGYQDHNLRVAPQWT